jgi:SAM-dependent methyltransferase
MRYLAAKGPTVGLDLSAGSLRKATEFYAAALQADAFDVPLPDASCGYVVSQYFFEHVEPDRKPGLLAEWKRLLRPGGYLLLLMTCEADNAVFRFAKTRPDLYQRSFIERDHHYGLQPASQNVRLIQQAGLAIEELRPAGKSLVQHVPVLLWLEGYPHTPAVLGGLVRLARWVAPRRYANFAYTAAVVLLDDLIDRLLPLDAASLLLVVARRP